MKEYYSPSEFKQNTWEYNDSGENVYYTSMDEAYNTYYRTYTWDLDEPLPRKAFEKRVREDKEFAAVWGPRDV